MQKVITIIVLLASLQIIAQSKKNKKTLPVQEDLQVTIVATIKLDSLLFAPVIDEEKIFSASANNIFSCYDSTGKLIWTKQLNDKLAAQPIFDQSTALLAFLNGDLSKINTATGKTIESIGIGDSITGNIAKLSYHWQNELMIPKSSGSNTAAIFSTNNGSIHCVDLETLQEYWANHDSQKKIKSHLLIVNDKIVFVGDDNSIYCLNAKDGLLIWRWKGNDDLSFSSIDIVTDGRYLFLISSDKKLYVLDSLLGKLDWVIEDLNFDYKINIQNDGKSILAVTDEKELILISIKEKKVLSHFQLPLSENNIHTPPLDYNKKYFVASGSIIFLADIKGNKINSFNFEKGDITNLFSIWNNKYLLTTRTGYLLIFEMR